MRSGQHADVNRHFMCDTGRADYRWMNRGDRVEVPLIRDGHRLVPTGWDVALGSLVTAVRNTTGTVVLLASGRASYVSGTVLTVDGGRSSRSK